MKARWINMFLFLGLSLSAVSFAQENKLLATADIRGLDDSGITGQAQFYQEEEGVRVTALIKGLKANSRHGFHIHEFGDCGNSGKAAGEHYNPGNKSHGALSDLDSHAGDLGNIQANAEGEANYSDLISQEKLTKGAMDILDHALIVHIDSDDLKSQPSGDSGNPIACGIIVRPAQEDAF